MSQQRKVTFTAAYYQDRRLIRNTFGQSKGEFLHSFEGYRFLPGPTAGFAAPYSDVKGNIVFAWFWHHLSTLPMVLEMKNGKPRYCLIDATQKPKYRMRASITFFKEKGQIRIAEIESFIDPIH